MKYKLSRHDIIVMLSRVFYLCILTLYLPYINFLIYYDCSIKFLFSFGVFGFRSCACAVHCTHSFFAEALVQDTVGMILSVFHILVDLLFRVVELDLFKDEFFKF
jgi:hypothetical protein